MAEKLPINQRKSRLSLACIEAVSSQAGYQVVEIKVDSDSVDGTFLGAPDSANTDSVTVYAPMANVLDSEQLVRMMRKAERTGAI